MNILHVSSAKTWRGGENQIVLLLRGLKKYDIKNFLLCPIGSQLNGRMDDTLAKKIAYSKKSGISLSTAVLIGRIVKKEVIDIIHVHDSHSHTYAYLASISGNQTPILVTRRVDFRLNFISRYKYNHSRVKSVVCVSDSINNILTVDGVNNAKLRTIHSGIDLTVKKAGNSLRDELDINKGKKVLGFVGAMVAHKDPLAFVKMASLLSQSNMDFRFLMFGLEGELSNEVNKAILKSGLKDNFSVLGFVEKMENIWNTIDLLVVTSKEEGLGTIVLESFLNEVPVVSTVAGGLPEMVIHEKTGLSSSIGDTESLATNVKRIIGNEYLRKKLITNALEKVKQFDFSLMAADYVDEYKRILN